MYSVTWLLCTICIVLLWMNLKPLWYDFRKMVLRRSFTSRVLPKGPCRIPFIGSCYVFRDGLANNIHKLAQIYGNVFTFYTFRSPTICINGTDLIRKIFLDKRFQSRPFWPKIGKLFGDLEGTNGGIILCNGDTWKRNRNLIMRHLRTSLGCSGDEICHTEANRLVLRIHELSKFGADVTPHEEVVFATARIMTRLIFGETSPISDPHLKKYCGKLMKMLHGGSAIGVIVTLLKHFQWLKDFPLPGLKIVDDYNHSLKELFHAVSSKSRKNDDGTGGSTFLDKYLDASEMMDNESSRRRHIDDILLLISDLYIGGTDTTSCTILHALRVLAAEQRYQERIFLELMAHDSMDEYTGVKLRRFMNFTNAFLQEILRTEPPASAGICRRAIEEAVIDGVWFPEGVTVICNIYGAHREEKYWKDPDLFCPERFLDEEGRFFKSENLISFSLGKRRCPGEILAQKEIYLIVTALIKAFVVLPPDGNALNMRTRYGFTSFPNDFKLRFIPRR